MEMVTTESNKTMAVAPIPDWERVKIIALRKRMERREYIVRGAKCLGVDGGEERKENGNKIS
jgi:hypothetical protein